MQPVTSSSPTTMFKAVPNNHKQHFGTSAAKDSLTLTRDLPHTSAEKAPSSSSGWKASPLYQNTVGKIFSASDKTKAAKKSTPIPVTTGAVRDPIEARHYPGWRSDVNAKHNALIEKESTTTPSKE